VTASSHPAGGVAVILGSGTSNGVPMLGVEYPPEFLANPKNHRMRSSVLLQGPHGNLLVDCTPEMRLQLTREGILDVEAILITHTHADHVMGMDDTRSLMFRTGKAMPVYTLPRHQEDIRRIYAYAFGEFPEGIFVPRFDLRDCPETLEVAGLTVQTFVVEHGSTPVIGLRVNDFAYITDVSRIPDEAKAKLRDLECLVIDAVRFQPHRNHFNFEGALAAIKELEPKRAFLTHLSHDYDHDVVEKELEEGFCRETGIDVRLAFDGLRIRF